MLWRYLREEIGVGEVTPADVVARLTREFLQAQADEWITRLYAFLAPIRRCGGRRGSPTRNPARPGTSR